MRNIFIASVLLLSGIFEILATETLFPVRKDGQWGFIDKSGKVLVTPQFDEVWRPFNPLMPIGPKDHVLRTLTSGRILVRKGTMWGYVDSVGRWVIAPRFSHATHFHDGLAGAMLDGRWSFIDPQGNLILSIRGAQGGYLFSEGLAPFARPVAGKMKWGFVNKKGRDAIGARFDEVRSFHEGQAAAREGDKWGYVGPLGQWAIAAQFQDVGYFFDGLARAVKDEKAGFIGRDGKWVVAPQYAQVQRFAEGLAAVSNGKLCGFVDAKGAIKIPLNFHDARSFREGLAAAAMGQRYGFIGKDGTWVIKPIYESAEDFSEGLAVVGKDGRFGFVDKTGQLVIPCHFDEAGPFTSGLAEVRIDEKRGYINTKGEYIWAPTD